MVKLMRTPPSEVGLQSARLVVGQRADSPSSIELDARLVAELVSTLALRRAQCSSRTLLRDEPHS